MAEPMTSEDFTKALDELVVRARAAGIKPLQIMAAAYIKQGTSILDSLLAALEDGSKK